MSLSLLLNKIIGHEFLIGWKILLSPRNIFVLRMAGPSFFEPFETEVVKQLADGTGYVKAGRKHVQAGPVRCQNGTTVIAVLVGEDQALILSESDVPDDYTHYLYQLEDKYEVPDKYFRYYENDDIDPVNCKVPIQGYRFVSEILKINDNQMGIVNGPFNNEIKIGPIKEGVGEEVQLEYIMNKHAYCHETCLHAENYSERLNISAERYERLPVQRGETYTGNIIGSMDNSVRVELEESGIHTHVKSEEYCLKEGDSVRVRITQFASQSADGELVSKVKNESEDIKKNNKGTIDGQNIAGVKSEELERLREQAEGDAKQSNNRKDSTVKVSTNQYSRSNAVRQYAKKRANGRCEGCNSPAPFQNKRNEPYLHVHHLEELSEGGDDSPDNVVCLCPNCHYRIHHGKDGSDYNERLKEKVSRIESNIGGSSEVAEFKPHQEKE